LGYVKNMTTKTITKTSSEHLLKVAQTDTAKDLVERMPDHAGMIDIINKNLPEIKRAVSVAGGKTQTQFMDNMLTVSHYTPIRNLRQILAQITSMREAVEDNNFKIRKKEIEIKMKQRDFEKEEDALKKEMLGVEIDELLNQQENTKLYLSGAIRTLANYTEQYNAIAKAHNIGEWNEDDLEAEEEEYHIKKAFEQAYCAAISHGFVIDEGNLIYLTQIGINGMMAQIEMENYLNWERGMVDRYAKFIAGEAKDGRLPTHEDFHGFLG
jgi:hypothetical protein